MAGCVVVSDTGIFTVDTPYEKENKRIYRRLLRSFVFTLRVIILYRHNNLLQIFPYMRVYLIRHTSVAVAKGICYGQTDVPLNASFEDEARIVKERLEGIQPAAVFSSPLSRCARLASFCGFNNVILDERLKELNFGDWEEERWDDIDMSVWADDWINPPAPDGESFAGMYERVASFFDELKGETYDTVFVFTHGGVICCARIYFGQTDFNNAFDWMPQYGEVVEFNL